MEQTFTFLLKMGRSGGLQSVETIKLSWGGCLYTYLLSYKQGQLWECLQEGDSCFAIVDYKTLIRFEMGNMSIMIRF